MKRILKNLSISYIVFISITFFACKKEDNISPILKMNGKDTITIYLNETYLDEGATATDDTDGDLTKSIYVKNEVNINLVGNYKVMYTVSDKAGNTSATQTRIVFVENSSKKYTGNYFVNNHTLYPSIDSTTYLTTLIIDSTLNNHLFFTSFADNIPKKVFFIVNGEQVEFPYQEITDPRDSAKYSFQGYGTISDSVININYFKDYRDTTYSCKANFLKQ